MRKNHIAISLFFILILQLLSGEPLSAYGAVFPMLQEVRYSDRGCGGMGGSQTDQGLISSLEDLVQWYNALSGWSELPVLEADIIIDRPVTLSETSGRKDLVAIKHNIHVVPGGILTLDNPRLSIQGPDTLIVVEPGGQLLLQNGATSTASTSHAIVVEKGGRCLKSSSFMFDGGGIMDKNQSNGLPGDSDHDQTPPAEQARPITNIVGFKGSLTCNVGERPGQSDYPSTVRVTYRVAEMSFEQMDLPIQWNLDPVNFEAAGAYTVKGSFSEEVLLEHNLSNPDGIFATLELSVQEQGPIKALTGNVLSVGSDGLCLVRLTVPILPSDVEALYVYRSGDGEHWQKCIGQVVNTAYEDFLPFIQSVPPNTYINYRYKTDYRPIWLRVEVVGSYAAGISNEIRLEMPASAKPGEGTHTGEKGDDGSSDGNRGGGGQSEADRELPVSEESAGEESIFPAQEKLPDKHLPLPAVLPEKTSEVGITASASEEAPKRISQNSGTSILHETLTDNPERVPPVSVPFAIEETSTSMAESGEDASTSTAESEELAAGGQSIPAMPVQRSRGVLYTAEATAVVACGLVLFRKLYQKRKRKP